MEEINLPENLYVDPREYASSSAPPNASFSLADRANIQRLITMVNRSQTRAEAITKLNRVYKLNKERGPDLGLILWNAKDITFSLLQELTLAYPLLSPPQLSMADVTRVCNALSLIQLMATHPDVKLNLVKAQIPTYIYVFLNTNEPEIQYDYLRLYGLGVIGALVKEECPGTPEIVHYLLESEMVPLSIRCMDLGGDLTKSVAALVLGKILSQEEGQVYCGTFPERFISVSQALSRMVDVFSGRPPAALLKNTLVCYLRLSEISRSVGCCDLLKRHYPQRLKNFQYLNQICDANTRPLAEMVLQNIMGVQGQQVQSVPVRNPISIRRPTQM